MKNSLRFSILTLVLAASFSPLNFAAQPKQSDAAQQALKKAQGVLKQLNEEKAALETEKKTLSDEKTALQAQVEKLESALKQIPSLQSEISTHKSAADALRNTNGALNSQLSRSQANERELNKKLQDTISQAKLIQADNLTLVSAVQERERWIGRCGEKNRDVIAAANELSAKYQSKSAWATLSEIEPFTGIGNVETQNTLQNYQFKLDDLKVTPFEKDVNLPH
jgi:chromosome segregation ATPase